MNCRTASEDRGIRDPPHSRSNKFIKNINKYIDPKDIKQGKLKPGKTELSGTTFLQKAIKGHKENEPEDPQYIKKIYIKPRFVKRIRRQSDITDGEGDDTGPEISQRIS